MKLDGEMFNWADMYPDFPENDTLEAVKLAFRGQFGDLQTLIERPEYPEWARKIFGLLRDERYRVCSGCWMIQTTGIIAP